MENERLFSFVLTGLNWVALGCVVVYILLFLSEIFMSYPFLFLSLSFLKRHFGFPYGSSCFERMHILILSIFSVDIFFNFSYLLIFCNISHCVFIAYGFIDLCICLQMSVWTVLTLCAVVGVLIEVGLNIYAAVTKRDPHVCGTQRSPSVACWRALSFLI